MSSSAAVTTVRRRPPPVSELSRALPSCCSLLDLVSCFSTRSASTPTLCTRRLSLQTKTAPRHLRSAVSCNLYEFDGLSSCSPPLPEPAPAASSTPRCTLVLFRRLPPLSKSACPCAAGIAPSLQSAAAPGASHHSAVSGKSPAPLAAHIPGKALPSSFCSANLCPESPRPWTSRPFPALRRAPSPSAAASPSDSHHVLWPRKPPPKAGSPRAPQS